MNSKKQGDFGLEFENYEVINFCAFSNYLTGKFFIEKKNIDDKEMDAVEDLNLKHEIRVGII